MLIIFKIAIFRDICKIRLRDYSDIRIVTFVSCAFLFELGDSLLNLFLPVLAKLVNKPLLQMAKSQKGQIQILQTIDSYSFFVKLKKGGAEKGYTAYLMVK